MPVATQVPVIATLPVSVLVPFTVKVLGASVEPLIASPSFAPPFEFKYCPTLTIPESAKLLFGGAWLRLAVMVVPVSLTDACPLILASLAIDKCGLIAVP